MDALSLEKKLSIDATSAFLTFFDGIIYKKELGKVKIEAIILDIDGTLLNSNKEIIEMTKEALITAQQKGVKLILASGRPTTGMLKYVEQLEMEKYQGLLVSYNGAKVINCQTKVELFDQSMTIAEGKAVLEHMKNFDVKVMIDKDDYMYVNDVYDHTVTYKGQELNIIEYESRGGNFKLCEVEDLAAFLDYRISKILTAGDPEYLQKVYKEMAQPFEETLNSMFTADVYYEFTAKGIDKAKALDAVLKPMGINRAKTIAFGDGHNDLSMIDYAGIGVAMGNAVPELKKIADRTTLSNDENGIGVLLREFL